jgi:ketosteroid isomerase-like protein
MVIREELEAAYSRVEQAYREKDAAALMQMAAPGFTQQMPDGQIFSRAEAEAALQAWFATTDNVTRYQAEISRLAVQGDEAVAEVSEDVASTFAGPNGRPHERLQANTAEMTWIRTDEGWRLHHCEYRAAKLTVDGKPVTPYYTLGAALP